MLAPVHLYSYSYEYSTDVQYCSRLLHITSSHAVRVQYRTSTGTVPSISPSAPKVEFGATTSQRQMRAQTRDMDYGNCWSRRRDRIWLLGTVRGIYGCIWWCIWVTSESCTGRNRDEDEAQPSPSPKPCDLSYVLLLQYEYCTVPVTCILNHKCKTRRTVRF